MIRCSSVAILILVHHLLCAHTWRIDTAFISSQSQSRNPSLPSSDTKEQEQHQHLNYLTLTDIHEGESNESDPSPGTPQLAYDIEDPDEHEDDRRGGLVAGEQAQEQWQDSSQDAVVEDAEGLLTYTSQRSVNPASRQVDDTNKPMLQKKTGSSLNLSGKHLESTILKDTADVPTTPTFPITSSTENLDQLEAMWKNNRFLNRKLFHSRQRRSLGQEKVKKDAHSVPEDEIDAELKGSLAQQIIYAIVRQYVERMLKDLLAIRDKFAFRLLRLTSGDDFLRLRDILQDMSVSPERPLFLLAGGIKVSQAENVEAVSSTDIDEGPTTTVNRVITIASLNNGRQELNKSQMHGGEISLFSTITKPQAPAKEGGSPQPEFHTVPNPLIISYLSQRGMLKTEDSLPEPSFRGAVDDIVNADQKQNVHVSTGAGVSNGANVNMNQKQDAKVSIGGAGTGMGGTSINVGQTQNVDVDSIIQALGYGNPTMNVATSQDQVANVGVLDAGATAGTNVNTDQSQSVDVNLGLGVVGSQPSAMDIGSSINQNQDVALLDGGVSNGLAGPGTGTSVNVGQSQSTSVNTGPANIGFQPSPLGVAINQDQNVGVNVLGSGLNVAGPGTGTNVNVDQSQNVIAATQPGLVYAQPGTMDVDLSQSQIADVNVAPDGTNGFIPAPGTSVILDQDQNVLVNQQPGFLTSEYQPTSVDMSMGQNSGVSIESGGANIMGSGTGTNVNVDQSQGAMVNSGSGTAAGFGYPSVPTSVNLDQSQDAMININSPSALPVLGYQPANAAVDVSQSQNLNVDVGTSGGELFPRPGTNVNVDQAQNALVNTGLGYAGYLPSSTSVAVDQSQNAGVIISGSGMGPLGLGDSTSVNVDQAQNAMIGTGTRPGFPTYGYGPAGVNVNVDQAQNSAISSTGSRPGLAMYQPYQPVAVDLSQSQNAGVDIYSPGGIGGRPVTRPLVNVDQSQNTMVNTNTRPGYGYQAVPYLPGSIMNVNQDAHMAVGGSQPQLGPAVNVAQSQTSGVAVNARPGPYPYGPVPTSSVSVNQNQGASISTGPQAPFPVNPYETPSVAVNANQGSTVNVAQSPNMIPYPYGPSPSSVDVTANQASNVNVMSQPPYLPYRPSLVDVDLSQASSISAVTEQRPAYVNPNPPSIDINMGQNTNVNVAAGAQQQPYVAQPAVNVDMGQSSGVSVSGGQPYLCSPGGGTNVDIDQDQHAAVNVNTRPSYQSTPYGPSSVNVNSNQQTDVSVSGGQPQYVPRPGTNINVDQSQNTAVSTQPGYGYGPYGQPSVNMNLNQQSDVSVHGGQPQGLYPYVNSGTNVNVDQNQDASVNLRPGQSYYPTTPYGQGSTNVNLGQDQSVSASVGSYPMVRPYGDDQLRPAALLSGYYDSGPYLPVNEYVARPTTIHFLHPRPFFPSFGQAIIQEVMNEDQQGLNPHYIVPYRELGVTDQ